VWGTKWVTPHAPFRKHERAELGTLRLHDGRQTSVVKSITKVRDGRDIQHAPGDNKYMRLVRFNFLTVVTVDSMFRYQSPYTASHSRTR
jgi:hypothetical protein